MANPNSTLGKDSQLWRDAFHTTDEEVSDDTDEESDFDFDVAFP